MKANWFRLFGLLVIISMLVSPLSWQDGVAGVRGSERVLATYQELNRERGIESKVFGVSETGLYIVRLGDPGLASYTGGIVGLVATSPDATGARKLDSSSPSAVAYTNYLSQRQNQLSVSMEQTLGRSVEVAFNYVGVLNAVAVRMSHEEAERIAALPEVVAVYGDTLREIETDVGPVLIGAPAIWNGETYSSVATRGEGMVIGVIDSGINSAHPSFAATDEDGYTHTNPYGIGVYLGWCATNPGFCNSKLIAAYGLNPVGGSPEDTDGHGSHTASTAGGNAHTASFNVGPTSYDIPIQGVAPRANIVAYKVCNPDCPGTASIAAINSAILNDDVDVINYSISGSDDPWNDPVDLAFLDASNAGIFVSASAGNSGPLPSTIAKTGPWNAAVGASTHNRAIIQPVDVTAPTTPPDLLGLPAVPGEGTSILVDITSGIRYDPSNDTGCTAFTSGTFTGTLALVQRGGCTFQVKVTNAVNAGATGVMVFNNVGGPPISMGGLTGTPPAFMLDQSSGLALRDYILANPTSTSVRINAATALVNVDEWEDIVGGFSSRGPSQFELLKPDYIAPGVNILAAVAAGATPAQYGFYQGTSMSSPHGAGAAALMMALHPTWSPAEIKSAMATTAVDGLLKEDGVTPADPFDVGSGRLDLSLASSVGLVFDETGANYVAANPDIGGDPKTLNQPSVVNYNCVGTCTWNRSVKNVLSSSATYTISAIGPVGLDITVTPSVFTIAPGATQVLEITADVSGLPTDQFAFGSVVMESNVVGVADTKIPVIIRPASANVPGAVSIETMFRSGSTELSGLVSGDEITDLTVEVGGLFAADMISDEISQDPSNGNPYNDDGGTFVTTVNVLEGALRLIAEITQSEAPDLDLYVGTGVTPSSATEVCSSEGSSWNEVCIIDNPTAGIWWVLVQSWQGSTNQPDLVKLATAVIIDSDEGNMEIDGPQAIAAGAEFDVTLSWDEPVMVAAEKWYGFFTLGTDAAHPGNIGLVYVDLLYTGAPSASIDASIEKNLTPNTIATAKLNITNNGDIPLTWDIYEETNTNSPVTALPTVEESVPDIQILGLADESLTSAPLAAAQATDSEVLWEQLVNGSSGIVSDFFIGSDAGAYSASDFVLVDYATIEYIFAAGFDNTNTLSAQPAINWAIYADNNGIPAGHPEDGTGMASTLWSYSAAPDDVGVDITGDNIGLDLVAAGEELYLPPGVYWLTVYPSYNVTGAGGARWNWFQAAQVGEQTKLISPVIFGIGSWTSLGSLGVTFTDTAFRIEGTPGRLCNPGDIPWLSLPETSGEVAVGETSLVDVVFDTTGLSFGVHTAELCIITNDPLIPNHFVDVELTISPATYLQVAHLAPFAEDASVTIELNGEPVLIDFTFGDSTEYIALPSGDYNVAVFPTGSSVAAIEATVTLLADTYYTAIAVGDGDNQELDLILLEDDLAAPAAGKFHLRLGHLAPFATGTATADIRLQDGTPVLLNVDFTEVTIFTPFDAGTIDLKITTPGGATTLIDPLPVTFSAGEIISVLASGDGFNQDLGVYALPAGEVGSFLPLYVEPEEIFLYLPFMATSFAP
jgi:subtilisin family serine protease